MNREKMAEFLVQLRKERNLLQQDVAELFAVTPQAVCKWEKGESVPDIEILQRVAKFYEVSLEEILEGERKSVIEVSKKKEETKIKRAPIIISSIFLMLFLLCGPKGQHKTASYGGEKLKAVAMSKKKTSLMV